MNTPMQELQLLLRQSPEIIYTEDLLQIIGYTFIEKERQLIKDSCEIAIMQWHEWDKTNYLDLYKNKIDGAEIWAEDFCKELYEQIEIPKPNKM